MIDLCGFFRCHMSWSHQSASVNPKLMPSYLQTLLINRIKHCPRERMQRPQNLCVKSQEMCKLQIPVMGHPKSNTTIMR